MTLWHASYDLRLPTTAVAATTIDLAASLMGRSEAGRGLDTSAELDTSG
ncbi:hypothetical protein FTUN_2638 [Frigoriglobus tundricola]|uniref:Uncharacterized protein n=1 Tax=Frigoriglobus tundricola TaxID=2774151 RepID=A0A6M5YLX8_9BACT|nr:hypothetical protein FTUN_2638 [Frigoriglobus tundricola]